MPLLLFTGIKKSVGETINVGSNFEISIFDLVTLNIRNNIKIKISNDENRLRPERSEVNRLLADNTKAKEILKWEPIFSEEMA